MTLTSIAIAALFGVVLTVNRQIAIKSVTQFSQLHGRVFWWLNVAMPFAVMLAIVPNYAIIGLAVAAVLSFVIYKLRQHLAAKAPRLCPST